MGDAVYLAQIWAGTVDPIACMNGGDYNLKNGFTLGDAIFIAQVWAGSRNFVWAAA